VNHLPILPILIPLFAGAIMAMIPGDRLPLKRLISSLATFLQIPVAVGLLIGAGGGVLVYRLGDWPAPFGIILAVDRLSALMLFVASILAAAAWLYALRGDDRQGRGFHALFQFQIMGIFGAFLTGDLFNLFVFFEILLIASYALLLHGRTTERIRAGLHYVLLNIFGSSLFLIAVGALYAMTGTLNMADMALRIASAPPADAPLLGAAGTLLIIVFGLKAAVFPLYFWLPRAYAAAAAPVTALFAIMTKVGLYSILRVHTLIFGADAGDLSGLVHEALWVVALITLVAGCIGALGAASLERLVAYLVIVSVGTIAAGLALQTPEAIAATLYYLIHSTWIAGALFLLAGEFARMRGEVIGGRFVPGPPLPRPMLLGGLFFAAAVSVAGMPPLSGFIGKLLLLSIVPTGWQTVFFYAAVLGGGLLVITALGRAGSTLFWRTDARLPGAVGCDAVRLSAAVLLLTAGVLLVILAQPLMDYLEAAAASLIDPKEYIRAVLPAVSGAKGGAP